MKQIDKRFTRQCELPFERVALAKRGSASGWFFHHLPLAEVRLEDGATTKLFEWELIIRDAVIEMFNLASKLEYSWSFSSTRQIGVLAAVRPGETFDVEFDQEFADVYHVMLSHSQAGTSVTKANGRYGEILGKPVEYRVHVTTECLTRNGFRIVSAYEPDSPRSSKRLPFVFGFTVYGRGIHDERFPIWRELLAHSMRETARKQWHFSLLNSAFALESIIDARISAMLASANADESYINHILRVGERKFELLALNSIGPNLPTNRVTKLLANLNKAIFEPRNRLAHGKCDPSDISEEDALAAILAVVEFIWDWEPASRSLLLSNAGGHPWNYLVDEEFKTNLELEE